MTAILEATRILEAHPEVCVRDREHGAFLLARGVSAILRLALDECPERLNAPAFRGELIDLLMRYLTGSKGDAEGAR